MSSSADPERGRIREILEGYRNMMAPTPEAGAWAVEEILVAVDVAMPALEREARSEALVHAVAAQRGPETGAEIVARAEALLGFLLGERSRPVEEEQAWQQAQA